jgi:hypothetical protein
VTPELEEAVARLIRSESLPASRRGYLTAKGLSASAGDEPDVDSESDVLV